MWAKTIRIAARSGIAVLVVVSLIGCVSGRRYTSLDLGLLPCEEGDAPIFFKAIEFDRDGRVLYERQRQTLLARFAEANPVTDLIVFVHGWNKNPSSAELDYQNFVCRLHASLRGRISDQKRRGGLVVVGVFWPSTITNRPREPILVKPISYFRIRHRAETVATVGLAELLHSMNQALAGQSSRPAALRLHLIGHSFGGRIIVRALEELQATSRLIPILEAADATNVVLINAALQPASFDWISEALRLGKRQGEPSPFPGETASYLFNVHSRRDRANRILFPIASIFNTDDSTCAVGACGVRGYPTVCVSDDGGLQIELSDAAKQPRPSDTLNAWNIDATKIISDHSDIYKGRVATLVAGLLYEDPLKVYLPRLPNTSECR
jgi:pimeloyl-ACP methyl ester carboxylesterase